MMLPGPILEEKVIPVARGLDARSAPLIADALRAGGISSIEVTVEGDGGIDAIAAISGGDMVVGAGTILTVHQADGAVAAGASFLVTPHLDIELIEWASTHAVPMVPGALTPTEIVTAWRYRPPAVKVFPAHIGGPAYLKSLRGPFPDVSLIPTGGIDGSNIAAYLDAGAVAVGVGGWLTAHDDPEVITRRAMELMRQVV
jgi:2-dehydro-3-deoxyphosphogluconate aldolase / (4S)-4-hydroxy-2-oxoglutarate aldolase